MESSKIALTFILVLTAFLGLNSLTGNESSTSITTSSSQLSNNQDLQEITVPQEPDVPVVKPAVPVVSKTISASEYSEHLQLSISQLATVTLMLQILEQADGGPALTE